MPYDGRSRELFRPRARRKTTMSRTRTSSGRLPARTAGARSLKLMTYNTRYDGAADGANGWSRRRGFLTAQLRFYAPDILGVQEASPDQVADIAAALPGYGYVGIGRDGGGKGEASDIYYRKDRFAPGKAETFWLSETPDRVSKGWDADLNRICTCAVFRDSLTGKSFWVFNAHLDHRGEEARTKGIRLILSKMARLNAKGLPAVLMGDFNSEPGEARIIELKKKMADCREISQEPPFGPYGTFNGFNYGEPAAQLIDYVFVSKNKGIAVKKYAVLSDAKDLRYPSDHFPVYVELEL